MLFGYVLEIIIIYAWYKLVLSNELKQKRVLSRSIKLILSLRRVLIKNIFRVQDLTGETKRDIENIQKHIKNVLWWLYYILFWGIISPMCTYGVKIGFNNLMGLFVIWVLYISMQISVLKSSTQHTILIINNYIENVLIPLEKKPNIVEVDKRVCKKIKLTKTSFMNLVGIICLCSFLIYWTYKLRNNQVLVTIVAILVFVLTIGSFIKKIFNNSHTDNNIGIRNESYIFWCVEKEIKNMCERLNIANLRLQIWESRVLNADSFIDENGYPTVRVSNGFVDAIYGMKEDAKKILLVTIGHELAHIHYKDSIKVRRRMRMANGMVILVIEVMLYGCMVDFEKFIVLDLLIWVFGAVFRKEMTDLKYWEQIAELRADRLAVQLYAEGKEAFIDFWRDVEKKKQVRQYNFIYKYYKKYVEDEPHPLMQRRLELLERRQEWYWWEYFEHALLIRKWRWTNRGWNGRSWRVG